MENRELNEEKNAEIKQFFKDTFYKIMYYCDEYDLDVYTRQQLFSLAFTIDQTYPSILDEYEKDKNDGEK